MINRINYMKRIISDRNFNISKIFANKIHLIVTKKTDTVKNKLNIMSIVLFITKCIFSL